MPTAIPLNAARRPRQVPPIVAFMALAVTGVQETDVPEVAVTAPTTRTIGRCTTAALVRQVNASARIQYNGFV
jgi:hypothetical protein